MATYEEVNHRTQCVIAERTNRKCPEIRPDQNLEKDLGFTPSGKQALSAPLNKEFKAEGLQLTPDDTASCKTVGEVSDKVWEKLPPNSKQS